MSVNDYYADKQNCFNDLVVLRKAWGVTSFGLPQAVQAYKTLNTMWVSCPDDIQYMVTAALNELERRCQLMGIPEYRQYYCEGVADL